MTNDWAVVWIILIFLVNNVVLMNLLIAIMSNTCKPPSTRSAVDVSRVHNGRRAQHRGQCRAENGAQGLGFRV
jgi:hypothetical protein